MYLAKKRAVNLELVVWILNYHTNQYDNTSINKDISSNDYSFFKKKVWLRIIVSRKLSNKGKEAKRSKSMQRNARVDLLRFFIF